MNIQSQALIDLMMNPSIYPHPVSQIELIETHISWVILTGEYVYKIKKPVNLGFLDFSTLEKRQFFCQEEVRLNRRLAPEYYLKVVNIVETKDGIALDTTGTVLECAVCMRQFSQQSQLDRMLARNGLNAHHMFLLAQRIALFHQSIAVANENMSFGNADKVLAPVLNCFQTILEKLPEEQHRERVIVLNHWIKREYEQLMSIFSQRKQQGFIRECHGDLHLRNIAIEDDNVIAFDGIEFSEELRWNDVISEIAFLMMDLDDHQRTDLAFVFLNRYLQLTGDYAGLRILSFYLVYRAIVRAMVSCIRLSQHALTIQERELEQKNFADYLTLAESYIELKSPMLILTYGLSGSGKTWLASKIAPLLPAIHIRSDIERKRLYNLQETTRHGNGVAEGIYTHASSDKTYAQLQLFAREVISTGYNVIVDATFLEENRQNDFIKCALELSVPFLVIHCYAPVDVLKQRIVQRVAEDKDASDANLEVLEYQLQHQHQIDENAKYSVIEVDTSEPLKTEMLLQELSKFHSRVVK